MQHREEVAIEERVKNSASVIAIITDGGGQSEVHSFLNEINLSQFADKLAELGMSTLEDLQDVNKDILAIDVGLSKLEINKFARNYAEVRPAGTPTS
ncbi:hypothetical protein CYMTET_53442 [Cymbomonas tetramitiformis]|uniref:SAM domain-containing protein n=1 Tax=Cymbomonas tetramitiformis TaxID=36881 RepID=A0AAE0BIQ2_9CHLO|nr:hypothetical protein CYMTET_53442 [Cymbomonas tetramitiformis]